MRLLLHYWYLKWIHDLNKPELHSQNLVSCSLEQDASRSDFLRESVSTKHSYKYVTDKYLDPGVNLKVHVNTYQESELIEFIRSYGFEVESFIDRRTKGEPELIIDYPHHWKFFRATKT